MNHPTNARRLVSNTAWNVSSLLANALIGFLLIRFFLGRLGPERFGLWVLIGSLLRYRGVFSMGLNTAVNRYVPRHLAAGDTDALERTVGTAFRFYGLVAGLCLVLTAILAGGVGRWFTMDPALVPQARLLVVVIGGGVSLLLPLQVATAALAGLQRYDLVNATLLAALLGRTVLLVVLLGRGFGLLTLGVVFTLSELGVRAAHWIQARRLLGSVRLSGRGVDRPLLRHMLAYGLNSFLYATGAVLLFKTTDLVIGASRLGLTGVTRFSLAAAAVLILTQLVQAFTQAVMPAISDLQARGQEARLQRIALRARKYSLFLILPAVAFLVLMGQSFLGLWVGDRLADPAALQAMARILAILAVAHGLRLAQHSNYLVCVGCGRHRVFGLLTAGTAGLTILLSVLVLRRQGGLVSVAWANGLPLAAISGVVLPLTLRRRLGLTWNRSLREVWIPALGGSLPGLVLLVAWARLAPPRTWPQLLTGVGAVALLTLLGALTLGCSREERRTLLPACCGGRHRIPSSVG